MGKKIPSSVGRDVFRVRPFMERKYMRQKCGVCGADFWALKEREDCGDAPCTDYYFFDLPIKSPPLSVEEVVERFTGFFKRNGHEVIESHPVVARWREDLYLTIASIVVFQPHVTSGLVPPPANPLVIAQPCIRLEDIDSVGYTLGRHLTNFIMGGHHAFNYPDKFVYFTDETVEYARRFFTEEIGVPEDELVFKESWWEGGGNAGPAFEVAVGGLEVATLVFMMYEERDGAYTPMKLRIVDTGYGIERIAWLTQRTPTAFHAIYGEDMVRDFYGLLGLRELPEDVLRAAIRVAGRVNPRDIVRLRRIGESVSTATEMGVDEIVAGLENMVKVFTLLDHSKTAALMLSDGVVPSNSGEGYLARLVLRRLFRVMGDHATEDAIEKIFMSQVSRWRKLYPRVWKRKDYIIEVALIELERFRRLMERAPLMIRRYIKRSKGALGIKELVELYDSHGIPPEVVKQIARRFGAEVDVPPNFYEVLVSRHARAPIKKKGKAKLPEEVLKEVKNLPATRRLFHEDSFIRRFSAKVVKVAGKYVVLDKTAFYPEGGGQVSDRGVLRHGGREYRVIDTQKVGDVIIHVLEEAPNLREGDEVEGEIDWVRRLVLMRHHTATHIILGAARRVLGEHVWQAGAEKTEEKGRLDITHYKLPSREEIRRIEELANKVVIDARPVRTYFMPRYEAERKYGFTLYQGGVPKQAVIRVVEIEDWDAEACFGTHLRNTIEAGGIKIVNVEKIQDGVVRLEYVAGTQVVTYADKLEEELRRVGEIVGGDPVKRAQALKREYEAIKHLLSTYRSEFIKMKKGELIKRATVINGVRVITYAHEISDDSALRELLLEIINEHPDTLIAAATSKERGTLLEVSVGKEALKKISARDIVRELTKRVKGRGGGKPDHATGMFEAGPSELLDKVKDIIAEMLSNEGKV